MHGRRPMVLYCGLYSGFTIVTPLFGVLAGFGHFQSCYSSHDTSARYPLCLAILNPAPFLVAPTLPQTATTASCATHFAPIVVWIPSLMTNTWRGTLVDGRQCDVDI